MSASSSSCGAGDACAAGAGVTGVSGVLYTGAVGSEAGCNCSSKSSFGAGAGWGWVWRIVLLARLDSGSMPNVPPGPMLIGSSGSLLTAF